MAFGYRADAPKRAITLSLNGDLVSKVTVFDKDLSGVVERMLAEFLKEREAAVDQAIESWNEYEAKTGSVVDEHIDL
ncbi:hypothetical protein GCM10011611_51490 [Aliidongia dinghuensis]|uniref:Uncharacterized protein n=1 Tax=Aliidongia dinghuensis TaxID=1867774 RepID=A0A8J2YZ12_9PROT|nr:type II toxin-antitoxin system CcdA family antitoxin [Aliidongia dinghuensis]GGF38836.1 hypothetical protein GCM10011611_51490 [Aliidongia dinghuensis]